jgi:hypothetical protein
MDNEPVLMVGGTGALGRKAVSELLNRDRRVRMVVRDLVKAEEFARRGVELVHGDMMDLPSLIAAMDGADSVITCAAGYTRHSPRDTALTDTIGNRNLVDAAATVDVRRFVLTSILTCDRAQRGVRYAALRPGAFIESVTQFGGDPFARAGTPDQRVSRSPSCGPPTLPDTWLARSTSRAWTVNTSTLAGPGRSVSKRWPTSPHGSCRNRCGRR